MGEKRTPKRGTIKVSGIIHKREKKTDPRLYWMMFQDIYLMYRDINNKEEGNAAIILTSMSENIKYKKKRKSSRPTE